MNIEVFLTECKLIPEKEIGTALKAFLKEIFNKDLFLTAKYLLGYKDITWKTHGEMITALEADVKRRIVCFPRGAFKSSIGSVTFPIWRLNKNPNLRILLDSELHGLSKSFLREIKTHMKNEFVTSIFGEYESKAEIWQESAITIAQRFVVKKEPSITCGGVDTTKVGMHFDCILADDYNSPDNSSTPEKCQKIIDHYKYNLNILEPDGEYNIIGTRYAESDLIGYVLKEILNEPVLAEGKLKKILEGING